MTEPSDHSQEGARPDLTWDDLRIALTIAEEGSLTRAARVLGLTQPTVGRRLAAFEARLGDQLFERSPSGLTPTAMGREILGDLARMNEVALAIERRLAGRDKSPSGLVTIAATPWFGAHVVTPLMARFIALHSGVSLRLRASSHEHSLTRREADLALRAEPFEQDTLVQRRVGEIAFGLYASQSYLDTRGKPDFAGGGENHALLSLETEHGPTTHSRFVEKLLPNARIAWRTDNSESLLRAVEAGAGIGLMPVLQARDSPGLVQIQTPEPMPTRAIWLGVHSDLRNAPRIRAVIDFLAEEIPALASPAALRP